MSGGHTPGPWEVVTDDQSGIGRSHALYVCHGNWPEGQLARINVQDGLGEREANARLIAAAPDLLETLRGMLRTFAPFPREDTEGWREEHEACEAARAAIARAEGR